MEASIFCKCRFLQSKSQSTINGRDNGV